MTKQLDEIFDIDPSLTPPADALTVAPSQTLAPIETTTTTPLADLDADVAYARTNITGAVNKVREALDSAILLAQSGDSPRAFEVVGSMLTAMVNANKELVHLHKAREETVTVHQTRTQPANASPGQVNIEHAVFVGKASDLLRELKAMKQQQDAPAALPDIDVTKEP
jgi:hypothetical protein